MPRFLIVLLCTLLLCAAQAAQPVMRFDYAASESSGDVRHQYFWKLLDAALASNRDKYGDYVLQAYQGGLPYQRSAAEVETPGGLVNIVVRTLNPELEKRLLPIALPLDKGLVGLRLFLIQPATQARLDRVYSLEGLRHFSLGQGATWGDLPILRQAGFEHLQLADNYQTLFQMLRAGRFELFPRGVSEIEAELAAQAGIGPALAMEQRLALHYQSAYVFYVARTAQGQHMAERVRDGLARLQKSGDFERLYQAYKRQVLKRIRLSGRRVFRLQPAHLPAGLPPLEDRKWWDDLAAEFLSQK